MSRKPKPSEKPEECECCGFETTELKAYDAPPLSDRSGEKDWFCILCAGTMASNSVQYPRSYEETGVVMRTVCYVGNAIIAEIRKLATLPQERGPRSYTVHARGEGLVV